jgi:hypothetical protein
MACPKCSREHDSPQCPTSRELLSEALDPRTRPVQMTLDEACAAMERAVRGATTVVDASRQPAMHWAVSLDDACVELSNALYMATELYERLEGAGLIGGNGHHARQRVAGQAVEWLRNREATTERIVEFVLEDVRHRWRRPPVPTVS